MNGEGRSKPLALPAGSSFPSLESSLNGSSATVKDREGKLVGSKRLSSSSLFSDKSGSSAPLKSQSIIKTNSIGSSSLKPASKSGGGAFTTKTIQILSLLHNLTVGKCDAVVESDATKCQESLAALCVLSRKGSLKAIILRSIKRLLINVFQKYPSHPLTIQSACDLVWSLAYHDQEVQGSFAECGVCAAVLQAISRADENVGILKSALGAVSSLCRHPLNQQVAHKLDVGQALLQTLDHEGYGDLTLLQYSLDATASVCHANDQNGASFLKGRGVAAVVRALQKYVANVNIVRSACIVLVVLRDRPGGSKTIVHANAIVPLLCAIRAHVQVPELEHILCALLGQLLREVPRVASDVIASDGVEITLECLAQNPAHYFIVEAASLILSSCCSATIKDAANSSGLAPKGDGCELTASQQLAKRLSEAKWDGLIAVMRTPSKQAPKHNVYMSVLKAVTQFSRAAAAGGAPHLVESRAFLQRIVSLAHEIDSTLVGQYSCVLESVCTSAAMKAAISGMDAWIGAYLGGGHHKRIVDNLKCFGTVEALDFDIRGFTAWSKSASKQIKLRDFQPIVRGALARLHQLDKEGREQAGLSSSGSGNGEGQVSGSGLSTSSGPSSGSSGGQTHHRKRDCRTLEQVHAIFSLTSALLLCRENRVSAPDLLERDSTWAEMITFALGWLRELRHMDDIKIDHDIAVNQIRCTHIIIALMRFIACTLYKERQFTLRSMASNGGVTLVLQLQKHVKGLYASDESDCAVAPAQFEVTRAACLGSAATILKLIGAGAGPPLSTPPPLAKLEQAFNEEAHAIKEALRILESKRAASMKRSEKASETVWSKGDEDRNKEQSVGRETSLSDGDIIDDGDDVSDADESDDDAAPEALVRKGKADLGNDVQDQAEDDSDADNDDEEAARERESARRDGALRSQVVDDGESSVVETVGNGRRRRPRNLDEEDANSSNFEEIVTSTDARKSMECNSGPEKGAKAKTVVNDKDNDESDPASPVPESKVVSIRGTSNNCFEKEEEVFDSWCKPFHRVVGDQSNVFEAQARFVAQLPQLENDLRPGFVEPYTPLSRRLDSMSALSLSRLTDLSCRELVYDWRQAGGEGTGRARSNTPPALPYTTSNPTPLMTIDMRSPLFNARSKSAATGDPAALLKERLATQQSSGAGDHFLNFESRFESGNLYQAIRVGPREYDLVVRSDLHTRSHHQWFYFAVSNTHPPGIKGPVEYKFKIINMTKPSSMFSEGMQPAVYSVNRAAESGQGWRRSGSSVAYYANPYQIPGSQEKGSKGSGHYYTLTFTLRFEDPSDVSLIAMCYPYTYSDLQALLAEHCQRASKERICKRTLLCKTLGGLRCDLLTITDFSSSSAEIAARPAVIFSGRVHPGETNASYMMEGAIKFLLGNSALATLLRRMYIFKVVPMLNPDGVYHGNSRTSLTGCDLNRNWAKPEPHAFPTIWHTKHMIKEMVATRKVSLYVDFHGHSRKKNIFLYGVEYKKSSELYLNPVREFPKLLAESRLSSHLFSLQDCTFNVSKSHSSCARVVVARELGVRASFTLEASFCGGGTGTVDCHLQNAHFNTDHYAQIGPALCDNLLKLYHLNLHSALAAAETDYAKKSLPRAVLNRVWAAAGDKTALVSGVTHHGANEAIAAKASSKKKLLNKQNSAASVGSGHAFSSCPASSGLGSPSRTGKKKSSASRSIPPLKGSKGRSDYSPHAVAEPSVCTPASFSKDDAQNDKSAAPAPSRPTISLGMSGPKLKIASERGEGAKALIWSAQKAAIKAEHATSGSSKSRRKSASSKRSKKPFASSDKQTTTGRDVAEKMTDVAAAYRAISKDGFVKPSGGSRRKKVKELPSVN